MTTLSYRGTAQGLREFLHSKTVDLLQTPEYRNNPFKAGTLDHQEYEEFKSDHEKWHLEHQDTEEKHIEENDFRITEDDLVK